jgi:hypothetical protein
MTMMSAQCETKKNGILVHRLWKQMVMLAALTLILLLVGNQRTLAQTFQHPGVLVSRNQLDFIKTQVANHVDPIYSAFLSAQSSRYGSLTYTPQGPPSGGVIDCGSFSNPDIGCSTEDEDGTAAYTQALLFWITGNTTYAKNAIAILNAYGHNLTGYTNSNGPLQAGWGASKWARAAEIIRSSNAGWAPADAQAFGAMMNNAILPNIVNGSGNNGNWELSMIEGMIGIAVYNNDANLFNHAVTFWRQRVPAYFYYFPVDGPNPVPPPRGSLNWNGQTVFNASVNGVAQETCRDFGHTEYGLAAAIAAAETAHIQGVDLFGSERPRLEATLEFHTLYLAGATVPNSVCGGKVTLVQHPTFEIGYNEYHNRLGDSLPHTLNWLVTNVRTQALPVDHHMIVFETLSHGADAGANPDFSVAATPSAQTVTAGNSASYTVNIGAISGFNGNVALAASGLPSGAVASFNPSSINGSGTSTLTVSTSTSTPAATSTVTITGTSGSLTHTATVSLTVNAPLQPDFSISVSPASQSVTPGANATYTASVAALNGFSGTVSITASSSLAIAPSSCTLSAPPTGSCTFTVSTSSSTPTGTSTLSFAAISGSLSHTATASLTVSPQCVTTTANGPWQDAAFANQTGAFTAEYDATPSASPINAVFGLSNGAQTAYTGFAVITRFNPSGNIDARNAGAYAAASTIPYTGGVKYHFRVVVNTPAHTYSAFVTPAGGTELTIGSNFAFRSEQATTSMLNWNGAFGEVGSETVCSFTLRGSGTPGDFGLAATPSSRTVTAGNSTSYTVNVSPLNGYTGTVSLSASGLPSGATASFSPASISGGSGSSTLNITTGSSTPAGASTITITGSDRTASLSHSTSVSLTVNQVAAPDFSVTVNPASQSVTAGSSGTYTVTINPVNGFTGAVSLSASGLPSGATASFNPSSVAGGSGSSTLTISTISSTPAGTSTITITGTSGSLSHTATASLSVSPQCVTTTANGPWQDAIFANQTGTFTAEYDATPSASPINAVFGLSNGAQTAYTGFAVITRFNPSGDIDARNAGAYAAASTIPYSGGVKYHFRVVVNVAAHTYSAFVTPAGGTELTIGSNFAFRSEQATTSMLNWTGAFGEVGSETVCSFIVH